MCFIHHIWPKVTTGLHVPSAPVFRPPWVSPPAGEVHFLPSEAQMLYSLFPFFLLLSLLYRLASIFLLFNRKKPVLAIYCLLFYSQCMTSLTPAGVALGLWTFGCRVRRPCPVIVEKIMIFILNTVMPSHRMQSVHTFKHTSHSLQGSQIWDRLLSISASGVGYWKKPQGTYFLSGSRRNWKPYNVQIHVKRQKRTSTWQ